MKYLLRAGGTMWKSRDGDDIRVYFHDILSLVPLEVAWLKPGNEAVSNMISAKYRGKDVAPLEASKMLSQVDAAVLYYDCNTRRLVFRGFEDSDGLRIEVAKNLKRNIERAMIVGDFNSIDTSINPPPRAGDKNAKVVNVGKKHKNKKAQKALKEQPEKAVKEAEEEQQPAKVTAAKRQQTEFTEKYEVGEAVVELSPARETGWRTMRVTLRGKRYVDRTQAKIHGFIILDSAGKDHWSYTHELAQKLVEKIDLDCEVIPLTIGADVEGDKKKTPKKAPKEVEKPAEQEPEEETEEEATVEEEAPEEEKAPADEESPAEKPEKKAKKEKSAKKEKHGKKDKKQKNVQEDDGKALAPDEMLCFGCDEVKIPNPPGKCGLAKDCTKIKKAEGK